VPDRQSALRGAALYGLLVRTPIGSRTYRIRIAVALQQPFATATTTRAQSCSILSPRWLVHRSTHRLVLLPALRLVWLRRQDCVERNGYGSPHSVPQHSRLWRCVYRSNGQHHSLSFEWKFAPIQITQLNLTGQSFSVVGPSNLPVTIAAGGTYTLNVQFNPAAAGTATGQLTIASNSSTTGTPVINLSGTGTTGTGPAALGALSCSSGAMTGPGTDACIVTLTDAAPGGGLTVNLSSSNSAVTVPSTVTVPANATSAGFTATVSSVAAAQAVTMTASAGSVFKSFALQLNAAILALSINATSVAFGDVQVNTPATQPLTLTSTGTVPVTIGAATLTGTEFTLPGAAFPATLSPGQTATLNIEFNPTAAGAATGQLTITSNSSTNGSAVIGLSGTGTAASVVAVAVDSHQRVHYDWSHSTIHGVRHRNVEHSGDLDNIGNWLQRSNLRNDLFDRAIHCSLPRWHPLPKCHNYSYQRLGLHQIRVGRHINCAASGSWL
jgi:hypothetical protein